jgi:hypothetical protein
VLSALPDDVWLNCHIQGNFGDARTIRTAIESAKAILRFKRTENTFLACGWETLAAVKSQFRDVKTCCMNQEFKSSDPRNVDFFHFPYMPIAEFVESAIEAESDFIQFIDPNLFQESDTNPVPRRERFATYEEFMTAVSQYQRSADHTKFNFDKVHLTADIQEKLRDYGIQINLFSRWWGVPSVLGHRRSISDLVNFVFAEPSQDIESSLRFFEEVYKAPRLSHLPFNR